MMMGDAFDPFENSSHPSVSEPEFLEEEDGEYAPVLSDDQGSYEEVNYEEEIVEENFGRPSYYEESVTDINGNSSYEEVTATHTHPRSTFEEEDDNDAHPRSDYEEVTEHSAELSLELRKSIGEISALGQSNDEFRYSSFEEEEVYDEHYLDDEIVESSSNDEFISRDEQENLTFEYLSIHDVENNELNDEGAASSAESSYSEGLAEESNHQQYKTRRIKVQSQTRSSLNNSFVTNDISLGGESDIRSTHPPPSGPRRSSLKAKSGRRPSNNPSLDNGLSNIEPQKETRRTSLADNTSVTEESLDQVLERKKNKPMTISLTARSSKESIDRSESTARSKNNSHQSHEAPENSPERGHISNIAVLGTMSGVGKSVIATAMCRILTNGGTKCAPFKSQKTAKATSPALLPDLSRRETLYETFSAMVGSNGQGPVSPIPPKEEQGYGEIATAQSMQAEACKILPRVEMNPICFRPKGRNARGEAMCTTIVMGKPILQEAYAHASTRITALQNMVQISLENLTSATGAEVVVIQGAGSCSELNLMDGDIVNLPLVRCLKCPWLLVVSDENGGVFAQVVGTKFCLSKRDWSLCVGIIINKVKTDVSSFLQGMTMLKQIAEKPLYAIPFIDQLGDFNKKGDNIEEKLKWEKKGSVNGEDPYEDQIYDEFDNEKPTVVVIAYPHATISNDLYHLENDCRFTLEWRRKRFPKPYPATTAIILPGSRLPLRSLKWLQDSGWADFMREHVSAGGTLLGLYSGYHMLGWDITVGSVTKQGIGLLPITSVSQPAECLQKDMMKGQLYPSGTSIEGFEVDCGLREIVEEEKRNVAEWKQKGLAPLLAYNRGRPEGMQLGRIQGTAFHGILRSAQARVELLVPDPDKERFSSILAVKVDDPLDRLAGQIEKCGMDYKTLQNMIFG